MLFEPLFAHARSRPNDVAIIDDQGPHTYQQLAAMSAGLGMVLAQATSAKHVGILLPASAAFAASFYGALLAGKSVVPINFLLGDREVAHVIADSGIDTVVTIPQLAGRLEGTPLKVIDLTKLPQTPPAVAPRFPSPAADDLAVLMYTSGTSSLPKGVMLTYGNLQSDVDAAIECVQLTNQHTFLGVIPLFHAFGMMAMLLAPIQLGAPVVYMARFSAAGAVENIRKHKVSIMFGVPSMFGAILHMKSATADDFKGMYALISGGEPLPAAIREAFLQRFSAPIFEGYGLTETSPAVCLNTPMANRPGSVGRPVPGAVVRLLDDDNKPAQEGASGEICLSGPMVMKGYYKLPEQTAAAFTADRFFRTGDIGRIDSDGYLYITGRKKELIISAGEKVVPREVEDVLMKHPLVADAAVVGRKDASRGEAVVAFIVPREKTLQADQVRTFCREQGMPNFKTPRDVHFVDDLPRSPTGKVLKRELAARAAELSTKGE